MDGFCILREDCVNLQHIFQQSCAMFALLLVGTTFVVSPPPRARRPSPPRNPSTDCGSRTAREG
jgi:hypothetical protein